MFCLKMPFWGTRFLYFGGGRGETSTYKFNGSSTLSICKWKPSTKGTICVFLNWFLKIWTIIFISANFRGDIFFEFMNEGYISKYLAMVFSVFSIIISTPLHYTVVCFEFNCHKRTLINRNAIKIQFKSFFSIFIFLIC